MILAAAGSGSRYDAGTPKQFAALRGLPVYMHSLERFSSFIEVAVIVHPRGWQERIEEQIGPLAYRSKLLLQQGGPRRQDSVHLGLKRVENTSETVLVHDAARPFVSRDLIRRVIEIAARHGSCVPVLPVTDTLKRIGKEGVEETVAREGMGLSQTPQGFRTELLNRAFLQAAEEGFYGTDESQLVERLGIQIPTTPGERTNIKITWPEDLKEHLG